MTLGAMQDFPLRIMRILDHAEREHGSREIVSARADGSIIRTDWIRIAHDARRLAQALERLGVQPGDRVGTLAMNHDRHLTAWFGVVGMGGVLHTLNPRLFDDQLVYIVNHGEDRVLLYDAAFAPLVERMKPRWTIIEHYVCFDERVRRLAGRRGRRLSLARGRRARPLRPLLHQRHDRAIPRACSTSTARPCFTRCRSSRPDIFDLSARSVVLPVVPMFHANSWCIPYAAALVGLKFVICADNRPNDICRLFNEEGVTHSAGVPTVWLT